MSIQTINLTDGGIEYTYAVTIEEVNGLDITSDAVSLSLGTTSHPGTWLSPDVTTNPSVSQQAVQLLIGAGYEPAPGTYFVWYRIVDGPETVLRKTTLEIRIT